MKNLYLSFPIVVLPLIVFAQKGKHQEHNLPPTDPTCGHKPDINLVIYNGLLAPYGGQEVPKSREKSVGAVTVANLNDTDADGTIDNEDNFVYNQLNSVPAFSPPKLLYGDQRGGIITCVALPNIKTCSYFLKYAEATNEWNLIIRDGFGQPTINLGNFASQITPAGRVWNITHVNRAIITITQDPAQSFSDGTQFLFDVLNDPVLLNSMN